MKKDNQITAERYKQLEEGDGRRVEEKARSRLDTRAGWRKSTMPAMQEYEVNREISVDKIPPLVCQQGEFRCGGIGEEEGGILGGGL